MFDTSHLPVQLTAEQTRIFKEQAAAHFPELTDQRHVLVLNTALVSPDPIGAIRERFRVIGADATALIVAAVYAVLAPFDKSVIPVPAYWSCYMGMFALTPAEMDARERHRITKMMMTRTGPRFDGG